jgi:hypothetical protein
MSADGASLGGRLAPIPLRRGTYGGIAGPAAGGTAVALGPQAPRAAPAFPHELRWPTTRLTNPWCRRHHVRSLDGQRQRHGFGYGDGRAALAVLAEGPVRFAPVAWEERSISCRTTGTCTAWMPRRLAPLEVPRPARGACGPQSLGPRTAGVVVAGPRRPVLADGVVYFAAGLWPSEGVFVHAVDAESGAAVWSNTDCDRIPSSNWDHGIGFYSGLTPQGYLAIVGDRLVVPCGSQLPAFLDLKTGNSTPIPWAGADATDCPKAAGLWPESETTSATAAICTTSLARATNGLPIHSPASDYKPMLYPGGWTRLDIERANQRELDSFRQPVFTPEVMYESDRSIVARDLTEVTIAATDPSRYPGAP